MYYTCAYEIRSSKGSGQVLLLGLCVTFVVIKSVVAVPTRSTGGMAGAIGHCPSGGLSLGSMTSTGSLA